MGHFPRLAAVEKAIAGKSARPTIDAIRQAVGRTLLSAGCNELKPQQRKKCVLASSSGPAQCIVGWIADPSTEAKAQTLG